VELPELLGLIPFRRHQKMGTSCVKELRMASQRMQFINGDGLAFLIPECRQKRVKSGDLVCFNTDVELSADGVVVQCCHEVHTVPATILAPRISFRSMAMKRASTCICINVPRAWSKASAFRQASARWKVVTCGATNSVLRNEVEAAEVDQSAMSTTDLAPASQHRAERNCQDPTQLVPEATAFVVVGERGERLEDRFRCHEAVEVFRDVFQLAMENVDGGRWHGKTPVGTMIVDNHPF
jgi:hypothetical protein